MSENNDGDNPEQPRQPRSLQGLMKFAMEGKTKFFYIFISKLIKNLT